MNTKADQEIDTTDEDTAVLEDEATEQPEAQAEGDQAETPEDDGESDEVVVSIGEEAPPPEEPAHAPEWVRELRKSDREKSRRIRELEAKLTATTTENKPVVTMGPKLVVLMDAYLVALKVVK